METCKKIDKKIVSWRVQKDQPATPRVDVEGRPATIIHIMAPKRPVELPCDIKKAKVQGEAWTIVVGLMDGNPYEVFGGLSKFIEVPAKYKTGKIVKAGKAADARYNLECGEGEDKFIVEDVANAFENATNGAFTRTISLALRHGTPPVFVCEQLQKDKHSDMTSFSKVMARVLKSYIKDGTKVSAEKSCPTCSSTNLKYQEGCLSCLDCGFSKC
jgi:ribonucleoside-diphosphate reductase alpha chain